eukprot:scaffold191813_cov45-Attheya_sp.AAC.1
MAAAPPRAQDHDHDYKDEAITGARQSETPVFSSGVDAFSDEEGSKENTGPRQSETSLFPKRDVLRSQFSEHQVQVAELTSLLEEFKREMAAAPPRAQDHDYKDKAVTGARQSDTPVSSSSSGIDAFSDEEEAQNCLSRENAQAEDGIFEQMKDSFSLMFVCNIKSLGFAYSVLFFALQVAILVLISINILKNAPGGNLLDVPVGTSLDVVTAQALALFVSLITQSDFLATFDLINVKYDDGVLSLFEGATRTKWIFSNICRFFVGVLSIAISFILIVQSTTVIDLFLNFAAVQFVSELDNVAFQLAYKGYMVIGDLEETTRKIIKHVQFRQRKMVAFPRTKRRIPVKWLRISMILVHAVILYSAWSIVRYKQAHGHYLHSICQSFDVHFGAGAEVSNVCTEGACSFLNNNENDLESTVVLPYGPFSGIYEVYRDSHGTFEWKERRPVYYQHNIELGEENHTGKFSYCKSEKAWVFTIDDVRTSFSDECNWLLRSPKTEAYSLGNAPMTGWSIRTNDALEPADLHFELSCGECESDGDCGYSHKNCEKKTCVCDPSWTGRNCKTPVDCFTLRSELSFSNATKTSPNDIKAFLHLEDVLYQERPVFYSYTVNMPFEILFYSDGRFNVIEREGFDINQTLGVQDKDLAKLRDYFDKVDSKVVDSNEVVFYVDGVVDVRNTLTFVSEVTTAMVPHSENVKWRDDWPGNGTMLHLSCLSLYLQSVCQTFQVDFDKTLWNECTADSCTFYNKTDSTSAAVSSYGPFSDIYEVSRDSRGSFEWNGRRLMYSQRNIEFGEGSRPGKFSYCESEKAWVFTIDGVIMKAESDKCNWLLRSPITEAYSLRDAPRTGWSIRLNHALVPADLFFRYSCSHWKESGLIIGGEVGGNSFGGSVAFSEDGMTLAVGAPLASSGGLVRVYRREGAGSRWTQICQDIDGEAADDESGRSVALSADGKTLAIGARLNDGNGSGSGHVRVYVWDNGAVNYKQRGRDIDGEAAGDVSGTSMALSADGNTLAIGAPFNGGNGRTSGHVRVYVWDNGAVNYKQRGRDIDGEAAGDYAGWSVALSADGNTLAIGANAINDGIGSDSGHVRVYVWDNGAVNYKQRGRDIDGEAAGDQAGLSVALSADGKTLAIGAPYNDGIGSDSGHVRVYGWDGDASSWTQIGQDIDGEAADDYAGWSVALSADGNTLAISGALGHVRVYGLDGAASNYKQIGQDIAVEEQGSHQFFVALSGDGKTLAIGAPTYYDDNVSGRVAVFTI